MIFMLAGCGGGGSSTPSATYDGTVTVTTDSSGRANIVSSSLGVTYEILALDSSNNPVSGVTVVYSEVDGKSVIYIKDGTGTYDDVVLIGTPTELASAAPRFLSKTYAKSTAYNLGVTLQNRTASAIGFTSNAYDLHQVYMSAGTGTGWTTDCYTSSELISELQGMGTAKEAIISFSGTVADSDIQYIKLAGSWFSNSGFSTAMQTRLKAVYGLDDTTLPLANFQMTCYQPSLGALYDNGIGTICGITKSSSVCQTNNAPVISGTPTTYQKVGTYSFAPTATDADGNQLTWYIMNKPSWATFDTSTGKLSGTATAGIYNGITIIATDDTSSDSITFDLTIVTLILTKSGQTTVSVDYDDGYYRKGTTADFVRSEPKTGEYIVTDNLTGLVWQDNDAAASTTATWDNAPAVCTALNSSTYGGYNDWRMPTREELNLIVDYGKVSPAINSAFNNTYSYGYWSSNTVVSNTDYAWYVFFATGTNGVYIKTGSFNVRCVRGDSYPSADFERDADFGIVTDNRTGLMWQDDAVTSAMTWAAAITYCEDKTLGNYFDWRLPNQRELLTISDISVSSNAISSTFAKVMTYPYWSSTTLVSDDTKAWWTDFDEGSVYPEGKTSFYYVRCVRGGQ
ncbi:MAG: DUF1566 domain-containing protein [Deferribacterales bacterium]